MRINKRGGGSFVVIAEVCHGDDDDYDDVDVDAGAGDDEDILR